LAQKKQHQTLVENGAAAFTICFCSDTAASDFYRERLNKLADSLVAGCRLAGLMQNLAGRTYLVHVEM
jgi:hypothetical protein